MSEKSSATDFWLGELAPVLPALEAGEAPVLITGLGPAARAHMAAGLRRQLGRPLAVVCPDDSAAETMARDLEALLREPVNLLRGRDLLFYRADSVGRDGEQKRVAALDALARGAAPVTVLTAAGLLQRSMPRSVLEEAAFCLDTESGGGPEAAERALLRCGYVHRLSVEAVGQYSRRGGILDLFSPAHPLPVRLEYWGDEVDSMGFFDPVTQRRTAELPGPPRRRDPGRPGPRRRRRAGGQPFRRGGEGGPEPLPGEGEARRDPAAGRGAAAGGGGASGSGPLHGPHLP